MIKHLNAFILGILVLVPYLSFGQQIKIPRIELMPDEPAPFNIRDWKTVAQRLDTFMYDLTKTGDHLPLTRIFDRGNNYPERPFYGIQTYVGTNTPNNSEAITLMPSLVSATLVDIDKSAQFGRNWVLMSQDFYNKKNGQSIYLNGNNSTSGHDWWYDIMPNVFFYQLYDLYPDIGGEANEQFISIADRFLSAVKAMGGNDAPWAKPYMNYRAWDFSAMMPLDEGVKEPEAAGAMAWVLFNAWQKTEDPRYLKGAEWCLDFLSEWETNPSYELQLPYGTYIAARMNAELQTNYNIEKMVNWSFDRGFLRGWGTIIGKWGGFDVSGLVGEANDAGNDYAFQLNGVQQAAMLVPMVRYDKRFANAIGKWMLNLNNASRLFYPGYLPAHLQDASEWSGEYDSDRVVGYEALREKWDNQSPYSTGDALKGGWAATNLALYGSSSIGYLGAMTEKTNVDKILRYNLNVTDFFQSASYPTWLYYNPLNSPEMVTIDAGTSQVDIYDAMSESWLAQDVSGQTNINIPAGSSLIVTLVPAGSTLTYDANKLLADDIVIDYDQHQQAAVYGPRFRALAAEQDTVEYDQSTQVYATVMDKDSDTFTFEWSATSGIITGTGSKITWTAPASGNSSVIAAIVSDESGLKDTLSIEITTIAEINRAPIIETLIADALHTAPNGVIQLFCEAADPNGDQLTYSWSADGGIVNGVEQNADWTAPPTKGLYTIEVKVNDGKGLETSATKTILVTEPLSQPAEIIAWYPCSGNVLDSTINHHDGQLSGALFVEDKSGLPKSALWMDGVNDFVAVPHSTILNPQTGIAVSCWFRPDALPDRESFLLSHGSWQSRWKVSITPEGKLRWTVNTVNSITDLDIPGELSVDSVYFMTATYDGSVMSLFLNGQLVSNKISGGLIRTTTVPLLMGQILPGDQQYNFRGMMDDVRIYNNTLHPDEVLAIYNEGSSDVFKTGYPASAVRVYPVPARDQLFVNLDELGSLKNVVIRHVNGTVIRTMPLVNNQSSIDISSLEAGIYILSGVSEGRVFYSKWIKG